MSAQDELGQPNAKKLSKPGSDDAFVQQLLDLPVISQEELDKYGMLPKTPPDDGRLWNEVGVTDTSFDPEQRLSDCSIYANQILANNHELFYLDPADFRGSTRYFWNSVVADFDNSSLQAVRGQAIMAAKYEYPVMITGPTGSGKEAIARAIYDEWLRIHKFTSDGHPFVPVNLGQIAPERIESDLFGHIKGAYTGSAGDRKGQIKTAEGGILFLDEIGAANKFVQAALLRFLESGEYRPMGSDDSETARVRIIAATNEYTKLRLDIQARFRKHISLPDIRERIADLPALCLHLAFEARRKYGFKRTILPLQIRNIVSRVYRDSIARPSYMWHLNSHDISMITTDASRYITNVRQIEGEVHEYLEQNGEGQESKEMVETVLRMHKGAVEPSAEFLGISKVTLYKRMKAFEIISGSEST